MKHRASTTPDYTIVEKGGIFKVYDRNQHFRRSFATRQGAQDFITEQRTGKAKSTATTDMTQAAASAA
jgi:hypothetical protein